MKLVIVEVEELQRLIHEALQCARVQSHADEWVDGQSAPFGRRTFLRLVRAGAFPASLVGRKYLARRSDIDAYLEQQRLASTVAGAAAASNALASNTVAVDPIARALDQGRLRVIKNLR